MRALDVIPQADEGVDMTAPDPALSTAPYRIYNIGNNQSVQLGKFVETLEHALGRQAVKIMLPMQPGDVPATHADIEALRQLTGFSPRTSLESGIAKYVAWFREYHGADATLSEGTT